MSVTKQRPLKCAQTYLDIIRDYTNQNVFTSKQRYETVAICKKLTHICTNIYYIAIEHL